MKFPKGRFSGQQTAAGNRSNISRTASFRTLALAGSGLPRYSFLVRKTAHIELGDGTLLDIVYEDRAVLAIDKPAGWLLAPSSWDRAAQNLQLAVDSAIRGRAFWASSRNLKFLRFVHRLDADTSGLLLLAKSPGALATFSKLFQGRAVRKQYLAVAEGEPARREWSCDLSIAEDPARRGVMRVDRSGKESFTEFRVLESSRGRSLILAEPLTGRTHQIRLHLQAAKLPILGDRLYGKAGLKMPRPFPLALRAVALDYTDPFRRKPIRIRAPEEEFRRAFRFSAAAPKPRNQPIQQPA